MKTMATFVTRAVDVERRWFVVDATDQTLGRLATRIASVLRGKHKPQYAPNIDTGDYVVVVNAAKVAVTGRKREQKVYSRHSGYPSGIRAVLLEDQLERHPSRVIEHAVRGMLPHNRLGRAMLKKLKVYGGPDHPHQAQQPVPFQESVTGASADE